MPSHSQDTIDHFIELRAQGLSFRAISEHLDIRKATLIDLSRRYKHRINNLRALEAESLSERCKITREACLEALGEDIQRIRAEIAGRDLQTIPTVRLFTLAALLRSEAMRLSAPLHFTEPVEDPDASPGEPPVAEVGWTA